MPQSPIHPDLPEFRERLRNLIRAKGYSSVEKFAHENGLEQSVLSRFLAGERDIRLSTILRILDGLQASLADLSINSAKHLFTPAIHYETSRQRPHAKVILSDVASLTILRSAEDPDPIVMKNKNRRAESFPQGL